MDDSIANILFGLTRLAAVDRTEQWRAGAEVGLNPAQMAILLRVALRPMRARDLAEHLGVSAASVSDSMAALVAKGMVERIVDPSDARAQSVVPTPAGLDIAARLAGRPRSLDLALAGLPSRDHGALLRLLMRIIRDLQEAHAIPVQGMCLTCAHFRPFVHQDAERPHHCAFVDSAFGEANLRLDCGDHEPAGPDRAADTLRRFEMT
jgi:DNA-binding MarR family transcriptional regulator